MRMLCCPARSPFKASNWLFGGTARSCSTLALFSIRSFRSAVDWISCGKVRLNTPRQMRSVSRSRNPTIMWDHNAPCYGPQLAERLRFRMLDSPGTNVSTYLDGLKAPASRAHARLKSIRGP